MDPIALSVIHMYKANIVSTYFRILLKKSVHQWMAIDELCIALQMEDCKMEVDKEENSKAVDKPKTTTLGKSVIIPNIWKKPSFFTVAIR